MKIYLNKILLICAVSFFFSCAAVSAAREGFQTISCVMHIHSTYSGGKNGKSIAEIVSEARSKGIDAVILSDKDIMNWEYGLWPLANLVKFSYSLPSVLSVGPQKYFNNVSAIEKAFPGMIVIPGVESAPFYYWKGNPFNGTLEMHGWHKHMLVFGMDKADDI